MRAIGIVLAGGNSKRMRELSNKRAVAAMPVAGSYRSIDFALSNMTNSHIQNVAVLHSIIPGLKPAPSSSKWWDFGRKQGGLLYSPHPLHRRTATGTGEQQMHYTRTLHS